MGGDVAEALEDRPFVHLGGAFVRGAGLVAPHALMAIGPASWMDGMQLPQRLARFNRHVTNPVQRLWAGWLPPFGIVEHVGRRSGKRYRTPVNVFNATVDGKPGVAIVLTYGPDRDWLKNLTAAGGGRLRRNGRSFDVSDPRVVTRDEAAAQVSNAARPVFSRLPFEHVVLLTKTG